MYTTINTINMNQKIGKSIRGMVLKTPIRFHMIPYHLQYETKDFNVPLITQFSQKTKDNRSRYILEFNPYLKTNVSDNLDQSLKNFYNNRYKTR